MIFLFIFLRYKQTYTLFKSLISRMLFTLILVTSSLYVHAESFEDIYLGTIIGSGASFEMALLNATCQYTQAHSTNVSNTKSESEKGITVKTYSKSNFEKKVADTEIKTVCNITTKVYCPNKENQCALRNKYSSTAIRSEYKILIKNNKYSQILALITKRYMTGGKIDHMKNEQYFDDKTTENYPRCNLSCKILLLSQIGIQIEGAGLSDDEESFLVSISVNGEYLPFRYDAP